MRKATDLNRFVIYTARKRRFYQSIADSFGGSKSTVKLRLKTSEADPKFLAFGAKIEKLVAEARGGYCVRKSI